MKDFINLFNGFLLRKIFAIFFITALVTGCSTVPDAFNPVEWYKGARDAIMSDGAEKKENLGKSSREVTSSRSNNGFLKLSSVPPRPKVLSNEERKSISGGLVADNDASRKYSNEIVRRQGKASNLFVRSEKKVEPLRASSSAQKFSKPITQTEPMPLSKPKPKAATAYLVPPEPVELSFLQNKAKLKFKTKKPLIPPKLPISVPSKMKKLPAINPNPPRIGVVPGLGGSLDQTQTIIISGSGVERMSNSGAVGRSTYRQPPSSSGVSGLNFSGQFNKHNLQNSYQVATILFPNGSSRVGKRDRRVLRQVIAQYRKVGGRLRIVGHASRRTVTNDPVLHKMTNFQVSAARAERVAKELVKMGVNANKLFVGSVSDRVPRYYEYMPSGEAGNRRAEIFIDFL